MRVPAITTDGRTVPDLTGVENVRSAIYRDGGYDVELHDERIATLEAQVEAATALASKANATAQEVARAMRDARPGKP